jgi:hypothetical protein
MSTSAARRAAAGVRGEHGRSKAIKAGGNKARTSEVSSLCAFRSQNRACSEAPSVYLLLDGRARERGFATHLILILIKYPLIKKTPESIINK